jgi:hypothetical protein
VGEEIGKFLKFWEGSQWEEENILGLDEFGAMTEDFGRGRHDWVEGHGIAFAIVDLVKVHGIAFAIGKWKKEGQSWRRRRGDWRVKESRRRWLGFVRWKGGKGEFRGGGRGGVRPG